MSKTIHKHKKKSSAVQGKAEPSVSLGPSDPTPTGGSVGQVAVGALALVAVGWAYWPTLGGMVQRWETQPDYSHGYLVAPIALAFLWSRRAEFPASMLRPTWWGLVVLAVSGGRGAGPAATNFEQEQTSP